MFKKNFWIIEMPRYSMIVFVLFNAIAMLSYPGGSVDNKLSLDQAEAQVGYSFFNNFFSDLGQTISHSGDPNWLSCIFFNFSLCVIGVCFIMLFCKVGDLFNNYKVLSKIGTVCGVLSGFCYIGVALTPSNVFLACLFGSSTFPPQSNSFAFDNSMFLSRIRSESFLTVLTMSS